MAIITTNQNAYQPATHGSFNDVKCMYATKAFSANVTAADTINLFKLPKNCIALFGYLSCSDMDTGTETLDIDVGYRANGGGSATLTTADGTTWTNAASTLSATGFVNSGLLTGDAVTDLVATGSYRPFTFPTGPLFFSEETQIHATINAVAATFAAGTLTCVLFYVLL